MTPTRRELDSIVAELLGPLFAAKPSPRGFRLASWDVEQGICVTIARGDEWVLVEFESRDDARDCFARTHRFNVCARVALGGDRPLSPDARRAVDQLVELVRRRETALPVVTRAPSERGSEVREILVDRVLIPQAPGHYYLNPYAGCMVGCAYCYVEGRADLSRALEGRAAHAWGRFVDVKVNAADILRSEVLRYEPGIVRMSPILTDPYQPIEKRYRVTRSCLEVLVETKFAPGILTRCARITDDIALLARFPRAVVGISIPTDDDAVREQFEPGADPIDDRLAALRACREAGIVTVAVVQPMLPMDPDRLAELLSPWAAAVRIDRMYDMPRALPIYERAGRLDAATDRFFVETEAALKAAFARRGVRIDPLDDLGGFFA